MMKETLVLAARAGAAELEKYFNRKDLVVSNKEGMNNLVTEADHASEKAIIAVIRERFPDHYLLTEESGEHITGSDIKWIIDPIDGTVNFAHGLPLCCVSIGVEKAGKMILGAVFNPNMNEFFFAEKDGGAFLNDRPIRVSEKDDVSSSCLVTGFPYTYLDTPNGPLECFDRFIRRGVPVRRLGSAAIDLCWVACGRFDGFYEHKLQPWDSAAGFLVVEEAGGKVTDFSGAYYSPYQPHLLASNGHIHDEMLQWLAGNIPQPTN